MTFYLQKLVRLEGFEPSTTSFEVACDAVL